jgi:hypothetical protein
MDVALTKAGGQPILEKYEKKAHQDSNYLHIRRDFLYFGRIYRRLPVDEPW